MRVHGCFGGHPARPARRGSAAHLLVALAIAQSAIGSALAFVPHGGGCAVRATAVPRTRRATPTMIRMDGRVRKNAVEPLQRSTLGGMVTDPIAHPLESQERMPVSRHPFWALLAGWAVRILPKIRSVSARMRRKALVLALAGCLLAVSSFGMSANAVGAAGRAGGTFGPSSSSGGGGGGRGGTHSRSYSRPNFNTGSYSHHRPLPPQIRVYSGPSSYSHPPIVIIDRSRLRTRWIAQPPPPPVSTTATPSSSTEVAASSPSTAASTRNVAAARFSLSDVVLLTGAGSLITYGLYNNHRAGAGYGDANAQKSALGPGATVARLVVVLNLPPGQQHSVLDEIRGLSERADTSTRRGVQHLVSSVALELLRREASIWSAFTQSVHFPTPGQAEREFQRQSIRNRSKFERETFSKFGSEPTQAADGRDERLAESRLAVVSVHVSILGDSTMLPAVRDRADALRALNVIAADAKVGDCLMGAEILWAPEDKDEVVAIEDLVADYPELVTL